MMHTNPYAPPKAAVADYPISPTGLKRRSVVIMIVLTIVTAGLYAAIWFFRRRTAFNRLNSPKKLQLWPLLIFTSYLLIDLAIAFASGSAPPAETIGGRAALVLTLVRLPVGILMLWQCFTIKDILEDHLAGPEDDLSHPLFVERVTLSGLMTFLFQIFYLQYVINRYIVGSPQRTV